MREGRTQGFFSRSDVSLLKERAETVDSWYDDCSIKRDLISVKRDLTDRWYDDCANIPPHSIPSEYSK